MSESSVLSGEKIDDKALIAQRLAVLAEQLHQASTELTAMVTKIRDQENDQREKPDD